MGIMAPIDRGGGGLQMPDLGSLGDLFGGGGQERGGGIGGAIGEAVGGLGGLGGIFGGMGGGLGGLGPLIAPTLGGFETGGGGGVGGMIGNVADTAAGWLGSAADTVGGWFGGGEGGGGFDPRWAGTGLPPGFDPGEMCYSDSRLKRDVAVIDRALDLL